MCSALGDLSFIVAYVWVLVQNVREHYASAKSRVRSSTRRRSLGHITGRTTHPSTTSPESSAPGLPLARPTAPMRSFWVPRGAAGKQRNRSRVARVRTGSVGHRRPEPRKSRRSCAQCWLQSWGAGNLAHWNCAQLPLVWGCSPSPRVMLWPPSSARLREGGGANTVENQFCPQYSAAEHFGRNQVSPVQMKKARIVEALECANRPLFPANQRALGKRPAASSERTSFHP